jgi:hypothetical protein
MKKRTSILFVLAATLLILAGCGKSVIRIKGNGNVASETRALASFNMVENEGAFDVYIIQDSVYEVTIEAESNLIAYVRTEVQGSTLNIYTKENLKTHYMIKLYIHTPDVNSVRLSGSGMIDLGSVLTDNLEVVLSGSGDIRGNVNADYTSVGINGSGTAAMGLICNEVHTSISGSGDMYFSGQAEMAHFNISGSGSIRAYELQLVNCYADISGSGDMFVNVSGFLDVKISGSGSVHYIGYPEIHTNISGSGSVISAN